MASFRAARTFTIARRPGLAGSSGMSLNSLGALTPFQMGSRGSLLLVLECRSVLLALDWLGKVLHTMYKHELQMFVIRFDFPGRTRAEEWRKVEYGKECGKV